MSKSKKRKENYNVLLLLLLCNQKSKLPSARSFPFFDDRWKMEQLWKVHHILLASPPHVVCVFVVIFISNFLCVARNRPQFFVLLRSAPRLHFLVFPVPFLFLKKKNIVQMIISQMAAYSVPLPVETFTHFFYIPSSSQLLVTILTRDLLY